MTRWTNKDVPEKRIEKNTSRTQIVIIYKLLLFKNKYNPYYALLNLYSHTIALGIWLLLQII
ncbi:MAG TPA: hypothetical protein VHJ38_13740, partial [Nitrososphaeraceae archaeon]|nr:hypothetical protein [Nitrososphaeraceae archaeon]